MLNFDVPSLYCHLELRKQLVNFSYYVRVWWWFWKLRMESTAFAGTSTSVQEADIVALTKVGPLGLLFFLLKAQCSPWGYVTYMVYLPMCFLLWQLTCLVLPREHYPLLNPMSIWNADRTPDTCALVEKILHLEPLEVCCSWIWFYFS